MSIGLLGNAAEVLPELVRRAKAGGLRPDLVTDQTSAHDLVNGYLPLGWTVEQWKAAQRDHALHARLTEEAAKSCAVHVRAMLDFQRAGHPGRRLRQQHPPGRFDRGVADAFDFPGFVPAYIRPLFCEGKGPFRWVALSGDPEDIYRTDARREGAVPGRTRTCTAGSTWRASRIAFQGLPARICWLGLGERHLAGLAFNEMVAPRRGEGADRHRPRPPRHRLGREPEPRDRGMKDGTDAVSDWPLLNALLNTAGGATWVSFHHGGGVGMGYSQHAGEVIVADGTPEAAEAPRARAVERPGDRA